MCTHPTAAEFAKTAVWLRNKSGMKLKTGVLDQQNRIDYFKGSLFDTVLEYVHLIDLACRQIRR